MSAKISFLTTAHVPFDDRIYYHQAMELCKHNFKVQILSSVTYAHKIEENIIVEGLDLNSNHSKRGKKEILLEKLNKFNPDIIICSEPFPVHIAYSYKQSHKKTSILYDITEWYPSKKNLREYNPLKQILLGMGLTAFNILAGYKADGFIFGEKNKQFPFTFLHPRKKKITLPYYPSSEYISYKGHDFDPHNICFYYSGKLTREKGIKVFVQAVSLFIERNPGINVTTKFVGSTERKGDELYFNKLLSNYNLGKIVLEKPKPFEIFTESLHDVDICFDLRDNDTENTHCLPIKIFYYIACGKPVIYTDLRALNHAVEIKNFGFTVDPSKTLEIVYSMEQYIKNPTLYSEHSRNARSFYLKKYNWELLKNEFTNFVTSFLTSPR